MKEKIRKKRTYIKKKKKRKKRKRKKRKQIRMTTFLEQVLSAVRTFMCPELKLLIKYTKGKIIIFLVGRP